MKIVQKQRFRIDQNDIREPVHGSDNVSNEELTQAVQSGAATITPGLVNWGVMTHTVRWDGACWHVRIEE